MLNQKLQQRLLQKLSPQQVLVMRLLQEPILSLEQRVKQEIEENPALEEAVAEDQEEDQNMEDSETESIEGDEDELTLESEVSPEENNEFTFEDYLDDEEIPEYKLTANNKGPDDDSREIPVISSVSFQDYLLAQLGMNKISDDKFIIAANIIGNLDDAGYLRRDLNALVDDLAFNQNIQTSVKEVTAILRMVQCFDPPGIAARTLQECLIIQLDRMEPKTVSISLASEIIRNHFEEFSKKHYDKIRSRLKISDEELKRAIDVIQTLNPKPGGSVTETTRDQQYIIPDFIITNTGGELEVSLTSRNAPDLIVNRQYLDMLKEFSRGKRKATNSERAAMTFIKQKIDAARGFIDAIRQRQETLLTTMAAIMEYQKEYFLSGDEARLKPMILKDVAGVVGMDVSTISRVANSKYVQTPFGTFLLKSFFSDGVETAQGEMVSTREVKMILRDAINSEDKLKPFSDEELEEILKAKGYNIARRTIAKYRQRMNIPVARLRKEI
jgi:RNA polymerase sigma-54 factor